MTFTAQLRVKHLPGNRPDVPQELPTDELDDVPGLGSTRIISVVLKVDKPAPQKDQTIKKTGLTKPVANVLMKAQGKIIEVACW